MLSNKFGKVNNYQVIMQWQVFVQNTEIHSRGDFHHWEERYTFIMIWLQIIISIYWNLTFKKRGVGAFQGAFRKFQKESHEESKACKKRTGFFKMLKWNLIIFIFREVCRLLEDTATDTKSFLIPRAIRFKYGRRWRIID